MSNDASIVTGATRKPSQYGVLGLLVLLFSAALGLATLTPDRKNWLEAILTALLFWILLGLGYQVRDLWLAYRRCQDLDAEQRWGWRFALGWRVAIGLVLAGNWLAIILQQHGLFHAASGWLRADWPPVDRWPVGDWPTVYFSLWIVLASVPRQRRVWKASRRLRLVVGLAWLVTFVVCAFLLADSLLLPFLVHITTINIMQASPIWLSAEFSRSVDMARAPFCAVSALAGVLFLIDLVLVRQLLTRWDRGRRSRWTWGVLLACGLGAAAWCVLWVVIVGLPSLSPFMAEAVGIRSLSDYAAGAGLLILLVTSITYRIAGSTDQHAVSSAPSWRRHPARYYHERSLLIAAIMLFLATSLGVDLYDDMRAFGWLRGVGGLLSVRGLLPLLVLLNAVTALWAIWRRPAAPDAADLPRLDPCRFLVVWTAVLAGLLVGIPSLAATGFTWWLMPW